MPVGKSTQQAVETFVEKLVVDDLPSVKHVKTEVVHFVSPAKSQTHKPYRSSAQIQEL
jgi:hypothetical protein